MHKSIQPATKVCGDISVPGDKSISHRALMLGAIANGMTTVENLSTGADVRGTADCMRSLGVRIEQDSSVTQVHGVGLHGLEKPDSPLDVGNSGTTIRLLPGILAGQSFSTTLTGDHSICRRPMSRIVKPLTEMGITVEATDGEFAPLTIHGGRVHPIRYEMPIASAQVKSCILFAGLYANGTTEVLEKEITRDHSERMLNSFGAGLEMRNLHIAIEGGHELQGHKLFVPGDLSSAAFFVAAAAALPDSELTIRSVGVNPTRKALLTVLSEMGAMIQIQNELTLNEEDVADLIIRGSRLRALSLGGEVIAQLIDEIPILAVLATQAEGKTTIRDAGELRHKESDRLRTICRNLKAIGAEVEELEDGLTIDGPCRLKGGEVDSYTDHRIAMAFAIAGLVAKDEVRINDAGAASVSFPNFYELLDEVTVH